MTDVNEEIVRQYLEQEGFFVRTDIKYVKDKNRTCKKSSGYSDIDILVYHPECKAKHLIEVNRWHTEVFTPSYFNEEK